MFQKNFVPAIAVVVVAASAAFAATQMGSYLDAGFNHTVAAATVSPALSPDSVSEPASLPDPQFIVANDRPIEPQFDRPDGGRHDCQLLSDRYQLSSSSDWDNINTAGGYLFRPSNPTARLAYSACLAIGYGRAIESPTPRVERMPAVVQMGDSLGAGEGGGQGVYDYESGRCHRSVTMSDGLGLKKLNAACSGAQTTDLYSDDTDHVGESTVWTKPNYVNPPQLAQLARAAVRYNVKHIQLTIGANDTTISGAMTNCAAQFALGDLGKSCRDRVNEKLRDGDEKHASLVEMSRRITKAVQDVHAVMSGLGYPESDYRIVVNSYTQFVSEMGDVVAARDRLATGCPFRLDDIRTVESFIGPALSAAQRSGVINSRVANAWHVDLSRSFAGHAPCLRGVERWQQPLPDFAAQIGYLHPDRHDFFELVDLAIKQLPETFRESAHPNKTGYAKLAGCIGEFTTRSEFVAAERLLKCEQGSDGKLHLAFDAPVRGSLQVVREVNVPDGNVSLAGKLELGPLNPFVKSVKLSEWTCIDQRTGNEKPAYASVNAYEGSCFFEYANTEYPMMYRMSVLVETFDVNGVRLGKTYMYD